MKLRYGKSLGDSPNANQYDKKTNLDSHMELDDHTINGENKTLQSDESLIKNEEFKQEDTNLKGRKSNLDGDYGNISLLFALYILQGIPLGMAASIPMILQNKNISYKNQAMFSLVFWPFSIKLFWAPLVDALFIQRFGRRKTWLIPTQYLIGIFMLILSFKIDALLDAKEPNISVLTAMFFSLNFLAATQDITVDGWALTMLKKRNVGYASTCNSVGQTAGYFIGNVLLLAFNSEEFCNKYIRFVPKDVGMITLADFLYFWGIIFLVSTTLVALIKQEKKESGGDTDKDETKYGVFGMYKLLLKIFKLPAIQELVVILLTVKIGFAATDAVTHLKLIEAGLKKEMIAFFAVPLIPLQILLPLVISKYTTGNPLALYKAAIPFRLSFGVIFAMLVEWTKTVRPVGVDEFPPHYYATVLFLFALHQVCVYTMFVSVMAFFARISDSNIGGTYMTLLNTLSNLGGNWPATLVLWFVDPLTWKSCTLPGGTIISCDALSNTEGCKEQGGTCTTTIDGYYVESMTCTALGVLWLVWKARAFTRLQNQTDQSWKVT